MSSPLFCGRPSAALFCIVAWLALATGFSVQGQVISEFLAQNDGLLQDEDGESPDWIEIQNNTSATLPLGNWCLTDTSTNLVKWRFPETNLVAGGFLVVFASGKDRRAPGAPLHTNFRLDTDGEYLALVAPDGVRVVSSYAPVYPAQLPNISYGVSDRAGAAVILTATAAARVFVPKDDSIGAVWMMPEFNDSAWTAGLNGVGFETSPAEYATLIRTDIRTAIAQNTSCYVRLPFVVDNPSAWTHWRLWMQYDDGFVAYLNGQPIASRNAPETLAWNSVATANHPDAEAVIPEEFSLTPFQDLVIRGTNVLAIQGLNTSASSSDLLFLATIEAQPLASSNAAPAYFVRPTPGEANVGGVAVLGPLIEEVAQAPAVPNATDEVRVTAKVTRTFQPVAGVVLHYRVMYGAEITVPMMDDGSHGDGKANDGVFGAVLPPGLAKPGEMVRYFITASDAAQNLSRLPLYLDPQESSQYFGAVWADPSIQSKLPVLSWFIENPAQADSGGSARCSVAFGGEFYDNVLFSVHGQSTSGFAKHGYNVDFSRDHRFRYATNQARVKDIKLLTNYADKSRTRNTLAYEMIQQAGSVGHFAFPVRVQRNGQFHAILDMLEDADDRWLGRLGRNPNGALYKMYNAMDSVGGAEKKTRREEDSADLQQLITNLNPSRALADRVTYAYDNLDLPQTISYFTALSLISSQDHGHKNFFLYRDSDRSGEWTIFPWDVDLSWGRNWTDSGGYFTDTLYTNNVLNFYNSGQQGKPGNRLYTLIFSHPDFRRMYLRRLRTVMDTILQAPGTPADQLRIEKRIREWVDRLDPPDIAQSDADLDYAKWGSWGNRNPTRVEAQRIIDIHLPGRRNFLFESDKATINSERIPAAQPSDVALTMGAIEFNPASGRQDEEYVELINPNDFALDVTDWQVLGEVNFRFKPGTVIPAGSRLYLSPNVVAFRARTNAPHGNQGLFVQGDYHGQLSARGGLLQVVDDRERLVVSTNYPGAPTLAQQWLRLTELMYHPAPPPPGSLFSDEDFEFIELWNAGPVSVNLAGLRFTRGVAFAFASGAVTNLGPGAYVLVAKNPAAFTARYGSEKPLAGAYSGTLDNAGEELRLEDGVGEVVFDVSYSPDWYASTDGQGRSLEPLDPVRLQDVASAWQPSARDGGSPGENLAPGLLVRALAVGGKLMIMFPAEPGHRYSLWHRASVVAGTWEKLQDLSSSAGVGEIQAAVELGTDSSPHFYRIRAEL